MITKENVKKILIIKLRGIGDVVLSTIVLDNLKNDFPDVNIDYLTDAPSKPGLEGLVQINSVLTLPKNQLSKIKLLRQIRKNKYDLILDFFSNPTTAQITAFSGAQYKAGFPYPGRKWAYNIYGPPERDKYHSAILHLEFLKIIGLSSSHHNLYFYLSKMDNLFAEHWLIQMYLSNKSFFCISPSGGWPSKKCEPEKFVEIAEAVIKKYDLQALILWGPDDFKEASIIYELLGKKSYIAPKTSIRQMAAFISKCSFLIANDSGPMHISTAVGTPVLSIHGPTNPHHQGPYGEQHEWISLSELDCIMCNLLECPRNHECFKDLPLNRILEKIDKLILKNKLLGKE
jgi:ADP-heptose:LPS heptosyltransferase